MKTSTTTTTMNISKENIASFATQMLGLKYDEQTNEFYSVCGQYAKTELVGTRRVVSQETILKNMSDCVSNY